MTLEEAIKILSELHDQCCQADSIFCTDTTGARCEAVDMAISALQAQDLQQTCNRLATDTISRQAVIDLYKQYQPYMAVKVIEFGKALEQLPSAQPEPCEDAVSRKAVYEAMIEKGQRSRRYRLGETWELNCAEIRETLDTVPPVTPKRNTGKWIKKMRVTETEKYTSYDPDWYCACCGAKYDPHIARMVNFCYVCGADMRGEQDGKST